MACCANTICNCWLYVCVAYAVMSCGTAWASAGEVKAGTGGRGGVAGGAFSLSVACESWLDMALDVFGREGRSVTATALWSGGGLGNSATICGARQYSGRGEGHAVQACLIQAMQYVLERVWPVCPAMRISTLEAGLVVRTYESSEPSSAALRRMASAA